MYTEVSIIPACADIACRLWFGLESRVALSSGSSSSSSLLLDVRCRMLEPRTKTGNSFLTVRREAKERISSQRMELPTGERETRGERDGTTIPFGRRRSLCTSPIYICSGAQFAFAFALPGS